MRKFLGSLGKAVLLVVAVMTGVLSLAREALLLFFPNKFKATLLFWSCVRVAFIISVAASWYREYRGRKTAEKTYTSLQQRLQSLSIELMSAEAVESFSPKDSPSRQAYHRVHIDLTLKVSNGDGQNTSTIEPVACTSDLRGDERCDRLGFNDDVYDNRVERNFLCRTIRPGAIRLVTLGAVYDLPLSDSIPATKLKGNLTLKDNRGALLPSVSFSADLRKGLAMP